jgi:hypothetical protein
MRTFAEIRQEAHRLCSNFTAGCMDQGALELGIATLVLERARCDAAAWWRRSAPGLREEVRCIGRPHRGAIGEVGDRPAAIPSERLSAYLAWMHSTRFLAHDAPGPSRETLAQAWQFHCNAAVAFIHLPTFYNGKLGGVFCLSNHSRPIAWTNAIGRDIHELLCLVTIYAPPKTGWERTLTA